MHRSTCLYSSCLLLRLLRRTLAPDYFVFLLSCLEGDARPAGFYDGGVFCGPAVMFDEPMRQTGVHLHRPGTGVAQTSNWDNYCLLVEGSIDAFKIQ